MITDTTISLMEIRGISKEDSKISLNVTLETNEGKEQGTLPLRRSQTQKSI